MLPTAPRRGCLAPSGRGLWRGAGRRVSSSAPGGGRSEPVQRAAPCVTDLHSLICGLGRAVSASAKPRARDCRSVDFPCEDACHPSPAVAELRGALLALRQQRPRWRLPPRVCAYTRRYKGKGDRHFCGVSQIIQDRCATRLLDSVISRRAIHLSLQGVCQKQAPRGRTTDAWSGRATASRAGRAAVLPRRRGLPRHAAGGAAARPAYK